MGRAAGSGRNSALYEPGIRKRPELTAEDADKWSDRVEALGLRVETRSLPGRRSAGILRRPSLLGNDARARYGACLFLPNVPRRIA